MPRVLIADDHSIVRRGLRAIISAEPSLELVGETTSGRETIGRVLADRPDVLILDLSMPDLDGIAVIESVKPRLPQMKILILTVHEDQGLLRAALQAGASGYVLKRAAESELVAAILNELMLSARIREKGYRILHYDLKEYWMKKFKTAVYRSLLAKSGRQPLSAENLPDHRLTEEDNP